MTRAKSKREEPPQMPRAFGAPMLGDRSKLDAEVERRKAADASKVIPEIKREPKPVGEFINQFMAKHNLTPVTIEAAEQQRERDDRLHTAQVEHERRERGWTYKCPKDFRVPFNWELVPAAADKDSIRRALAYQFGARGIFAIGESGRCKTRACYAMLKRLYVDEGRSVETIDGILFSSDCSRVMADASQTRLWLAAMVKPDVLFIDDLAKRFTRATQEGFFAVLDQRTARQKPLILTTNCDGESLAKMINDTDLSEPMRRRLREFCTPLIF